MLEKRSGYVPKTIRWRLVHRPLLLFKSLEARPTACRGPRKFTELLRFIEEFPTTLLIGHCPNRSCRREAVLAFAFRCRIRIFSLRSLLLAEYVQGYLKENLHISTEMYRIKDGFLIPSYALVLNKFRQSVDSRFDRIHLCGTRNVVRNDMQARHWQAKIYLGPFSSLVPLHQCIRVFGSFRKKTS